MKNVKKTTLTCQQVFELWKSEPELIFIVDIRNSEAFLQLHIPGSIQLHRKNIIRFLSDLGNKLAVIVSDDKDRAELEDELRRFDNFIIVKDFNRWTQLAKEMAHLKHTIINNIPEVDCETVNENSKKARLIDVRRPDEFSGELGHIPGSELITQGPELDQFLAHADKDQMIIFICRSGARSGKATEESLKLGFKYTYNMTGGMLRWNECQLPVEKN